MRYALVIKLLMGIIMYCNPKIFMTNKDPAEGLLPKGLDVEKLASKSPRLAA
jgi:hypothetical protein